MPQDPLDQLEAAVTGIWQSWVGAKAVAYRKMNRLADDLGTAVTVQRMVYGNAGGTSGAGVAFTRDPASGEPELYLDFLFNAQGEDVVSGRSGAPDGQRLATILPGIKKGDRASRGATGARLRQLVHAGIRVHSQGVWSLLHPADARTGKRSPWAEIRIATDLVDEGLISPDVALRRTTDMNTDRLGRLR